MVSTILIEIILSVETGKVNLLWGINRVFTRSSLSERSLCVGMFSCYMLACLCLSQRLRLPNRALSLNSKNIFVGSCLIWCLDFCRLVFSFCTMPRSKIRRDGQTFRIIRHLQTHFKISKKESNWPDLNALLLTLVMNIIIIFIYCNWVVTRWQWLFIYCHV